MKLDRQTNKLYYNDFYLSQATAKIIKVGADYIELDATVAFPEGGGQEADQGSIFFPDGRNIRFTGAKKIYTNFSGLKEFPDVQVDGVIWHLVHIDDQIMLAGLEIGSEVIVSIDIERRSRLSLSHTASHLLYIGVGMHRPDAVKSILGCHIKINSARFDFGIKDRFTPEEITQIEACANQFVKQNSLVSVSTHSIVHDVRFWHCAEQVIPCGGTHVDCCAPIGLLSVHRKSLGAGKERLSCNFPAAIFDVDRYHK